MSVCEEKLEAVIRETVTANQPLFRGADVKFRREIDFDGEEVLRIDVLYDGDRRDLDYPRVNALSVHLMDALRHVGEPAFPIMSYVPRARYRAAKRDLAPIR